MFCFLQILLRIYFTITIVRQTYAYGYDSGGACDPRASRKGRAQLIASIPCDLSTQSYCNLPGSSYPWHAVRRFVHENQGLMKRMYGDIRQVSVLKNEFDGNYLETEDQEVFETTFDRYSEKRFRAMKLDKNTPSSQLNKKNRKSDTIMEPHFRLQSTSTTPSSSTTTSTTTTSSTTQKSTISNTNTVTTKKPIAYSKDYYLLANDSVSGDFEIETNKLNVENESLMQFNEEDAVTVVTLPTPNESESSTMTTKTTTTTTTTTERNLSQETYSGSESGEESYEHGDEFDGHISSEEEDDVTQTMKGQLFQDTVQKQVVNPPINARGV